MTLDFKINDQVLDENIIIKMKMNYSLFTSSKDSDRTSTMFHMHP